MKKIISLIKASMTDNMSIFKIKTKNQTKAIKKLLPIFVVVSLFFSLWSYANMFMEPLSQVHLEYVVLTLFILLTSIMTLIEGIYKAGNLLFNCKDDNLMFSLPIKKSTVLFIRIFKFYVFEILYNAIFLVPAMVAYIRYAGIDATFVIASLLALVLLPIIPVVISCFIGGFISAASSKFKLKNIVQILLTTVLLLGVFYFSFNLQNIIKDITKNATSINEVITKLYYPAGAYIKLITDFNVKDLGLFIAIHIALFTITAFLLGKAYFKINSKVKTVKTSKTNNLEYRIKTHTPMKSLVKKELRKFVSSPVFVINTGFGLVLFLAGCILINIKFESTVQMVVEQGFNITIEQIKEYMPVIQFGLVCFASLMSSITCSMISLDGKTINVLKSLPVKPYKIIMSKVYTAVLIMLPFIFAGDIIMFVNFKFNILEMVMILIASIVLPFVSELIGIIVNLKYPKMDAQNDTEVVKQSMSSLIAVSTGMILIGLTIFLLYKAIQKGMQIDLVVFSGIAIYTVMYIVLMLYLKKKGVKDFNSISV